MKAQKLPSGSWRVRTCVAGVRRSFTAATKREAEMLAAQYLARGAIDEKKGVTVGQALTSYVSDRRAVLSPSTLQGYEKLLRTAYGQISEKRVPALTAADVQRFVSAYSADHSPKSVRNAFALLLSAVRAVRPDFSPPVRLPQPIKPEDHTPGEADVAALLKYIKGRDRDLYAAVLLAAFGPLRRGEVCGLTGADVDHKRGTVTVRRNMVAGPSGYVVKQPKTAAGYRVVSLPAAVLAELPVVGPADPVVSIPPHSVSYRFKAAARACGLPDVHFHGLRHFGASILHAWGVPDVYILRRGGWSSDNVMKRVYRDALDETAVRVSGAINAEIVTRFGGIFESLDTPMDTDTRGSNESRTKPR